MLSFSSLVSFYGTPNPPGYSSDSHDEKADSLHYEQSTTSSAPARLLHTQLALPSTVSAHVEALESQLRACVSGHDRGHDASNSNPPRLYEVEADETRDTTTRSTELELGPRRPSSKRGVSRPKPQSFCGMDLKLEHPACGSAKMPLVYLMSAEVHLVAVHANMH